MNIISHGVILTESHWNPKMALKLVTILKCSFLTFKKGSQEDFVVIHAYVSVGKANNISNN